MKTEELIQEESAYLDDAILRGSIFKSTATHVKRAFKKIAESARADERARLVKEFDRFSPYQDGSKPFSGDIMLHEREFVEVRNLLKEPLAAPRSEDKQ